MFVEKIESWRLTMTLPFLNRSSQVLFLVTGASKANRVQEVLEGGGGAEPLPVQRINPASGFVTWYLDAAAAGME